MIVVADAGPLRYLVEVSLISEVPALYGDLYIPKAVLHELSRPVTPDSVKLWLTSAPAWFHVAEAAQATQRILSLGLGESEALRLAGELGAEFLLLDDQAARKAAAKYTTSAVTGTLGVVYELSRRSLKPSEHFRESVERLRSTTFYFSHSLNQVIEQLQTEMEELG